MQRCRPAGARDAVLEAIASRKALAKFFRLLPVSEEQRLLVERFDKLLLFLVAEARAFCVRRRFGFGAAVNGECRCFHKNRHRFIAPFICSVCRATSKHGGSNPGGGAAG